MPENLGYQDYVPRKEFDDYKLRVQHLLNVLTQAFDKNATIMENTQVSFQSLIEVVQEQVQSGNMDRELAKKNYELLKRIEQKLLPPSSE